MPARRGGPKSWRRSATAGISLGRLALDRISFPVGLSVGRSIERCCAVIYPCCAVLPLVRPACHGPRTGRPSRSTARRCSRARPSSRNSRMRCRRRPKAKVGASRTISTARSASIPPRRSGEPQNRTFVLDLLYPGFIFEVPVNINLVVGGTARRVLFEQPTVRVRPRGAARGGNRRVPGLSRASECALRSTRRTMPTSSSSFRARATSARSRKVSSTAVAARGLAVRTARPEGEEFPYFTDFWIERPPENAEQIVVHALLQSPSVVGAYSFTARPGEETVVDVVATLFPRVELTAFGIAPLTSMFLFDGSNRTRFDDYRNAVHDSDGLQIVNGRGERLWRPLANPRTTAGVGVPGRQPERIRLAAAQAGVRGLPGRRSAIRAAAVAVGRAERGMGPGARRARRDSVAARDERQHRRVLAARHADSRRGRAPSFRIGCASRPSRSTTRSRASSRRASGSR